MTRLFSTMPTLRQRRLRKLLHDAVYPVIGALSIIAALAVAFHFDARADAALAVVTAGAK